tara:strand:- start:2397 stop:3194 length:798 start_codon:yes stop_codon:yes gene_type:complete
MGIISPKGFVEGNVSSFNDLNDVDKKWTELGSNVNGLNVREEGLDRRVIKTSAWIPDTRDSKSNYSSSGSTIELNFPSYDFAIMSKLSGQVGGSSGVLGPPAIQARWTRSDTQAIMVRCSFRMTWNCSKIMTHDSAGVQNQAQGPFEVHLMMSNGSSDDDAPGPRTEATATWQLTGAFGSSGAYVRSGNIEHSYDRRSNMSGSVTLCSLVTPDDIWDGTSDIDFTWKLSYRHKGAPSGGSGFPGPKTHAGVQIHDMNFYAIPFNR